MADRHNLTAIIAIIYCFVGNSDIYSYLAVILILLLLFAAGILGLLIISLFLIKKKYMMIYNWVKLNVNLIIRAKKWKRNNIVSDMWQVSRKCKAYGSLNFYLISG